MEQSKNVKTKEKEFEIIPTFNKNGEKIETVIQNAFLKFLNYNDYK